MKPSIGIGFRKPLGDWLLQSSSAVTHLEITAEHFFGGGEDFLQTLSKKYDLFVHGLGLSLGTPGPLCKTTLRQFASVAQAAEAKWVSEHVAFSRTSDVDLGHLNPVPRTKESLSCLVDHAIEVSQYCGKPIVLENITSSLDPGGTIEETDFLNQLCENANCGLLLDATNLFINSKNLDYDPVAWLHRIDAHRIKQLHVVGYSEHNGVFHDHHSKPIQADLMELIKSIIDYADVEAITLERDDRLDETHEIDGELERLSKVVRKHSNSHSNDN
jgi:uncharacterized protein (UPF0276 family)